MANVVHIVNGDNTAQILTKSALEGDVVVWREYFCEGELLKDIGSDDFWRARYSFFEEEYGIGKLEYFDRSIKEIIKLDDLPKNSEVVLWFEYDLFCQINLLAACAILLKNFRKDLNYYLVCVGKISGKERLQTLSDFLPNEYHSLFENKVKLSKNDLNFAKRCWDIFAENKIEEFSNFSFNQNAKFPYIQNAINQHLQTFPSQNGLNQIENKILEVINDGVFSENEIISALLVWQQQETVYGYGDLQYINYLKKLDKNYSIKNSKYYLNKTGKQLVLGNENN